MQIAVYSDINHLGVLVTRIQVIDVSIFIGLTSYIPDTSTKTSGSQAQKEKWSVPLDVNGSTGAALVFEPRACLVRGGLPNHQATAAVSHTGCAKKTEHV